MLNASDFASVQDAVNSIPSGGGAVYVPRGVWTDTATPRYSAVGSSTLSLPSDRAVRIIGDGPDATIFRSSNSSQPIVTVPSDGSALERLTIESTASLPGSGTPSRGIVVGRTNQVMKRFTTVDVTIRNTPGYGLYIRGNEGGETTLSIWGHHSRLRVLGNLSEGGIWIGPACTTQVFLDCIVEAFKGWGLKAQSTEGMTLDSCTFEDSLDHAQPYVTLDNVSGVVVDRCWFESHGTGDTQYFIQIAGVVRGIEIRSAHCVRNDNVATAKIVTIDGLSRNILLVNLDAGLAVTPTGTDDVKIQNTLSEVVLIGGTIATPASFFPLRVSGAPALSSWLETGGRVRVPQAAGTGSLSDIANGDMVYNSSTNKLNIRVNGAWAGVSTTTP